MESPESKEAEENLDEENIALETAEDLLSVAIERDEHGDIEDPGAEAASSQPPGTKPKGYIPNMTKELVKDAKRAASKQ